MLPKSDHLGFGTTEAASLLNVSDATVRRRIREGTLVAVPDSHPMLVTRDSILSARRDLAAELGMYLESTSECNHPETSAIQAENERLRTTVLSLRTVVTILNDALADYTSPKIPNN